MNAEGDICVHFPTEELEIGIPYQYHQNSRLYCSGSNRFRLKEGESWKKSGRLMRGLVTIRRTYQTAAGVSKCRKYL